MISLKHLFWKCSKTLSCIQSLVETISESEQTTIAVLWILCQLSGSNTTLTLLTNVMLLTWFLETDHFAFMLLVIVKPLLPEVENISSSKEERKKKI